MLRDSTPSPTPLAIGPYVREEILARLGEALHIALRRLPDRLDRFRDLLTDLVERVDGITLVRAADQPASRLAVSTLGRAGGEPVTEFLLIPFGEVGVERPVAGESFVFTRDHAEAACRWFAEMGRKLAIDYEHQSFDRCNTRRDGLRPAAGWIGGLETRDDGLWAVNVSWTDRARELLAAGEYRYFSPVIFWTDEDHAGLAALGPVALTNDPAIRGVQPLAAGRMAAEEEPQSEDVDGGAALSDAQAEIEMLRRQLAGLEADAFVERGLRLGKIIDATSMDWRADYLRDPAATEERLARAPVLRPPGRVTGLDRQGEVGPPTGRSTSLRSPLGGGAVGSAASAAFEAEDLAAYDQAAAAGRVVTPRVA